MLSKWFFPTSLVPRWLSDGSFPASLVPRKLSNESIPASLVPPRLSKWLFPTSLVPPWCLAGCPMDPFLPPWCLANCPMNPFLPPWCLPVKGNQRHFKGQSCATGSQPWSPPQDLPRTGPIAIGIVLKVIQNPAQILTLNPKRLRVQTPNPSREAGQDHVDSPRGTREAGKD